MWKGKLNMNNVASLNYVSHREFTRVKDQFPEDCLSYYTTRTLMVRTPNDDSSFIIWQWKGEREKLFAIEEILVPDSRGGYAKKKDYIVWPEAYKLIKVMNAIRKEVPDNGSGCDGISW